MTIGFDHSYTLHIPEVFYKNLEKYGFTIDFDRCVEHPGKLFCRFLGVGKSYLEFINVPDIEYYEANRENHETQTVGLSFKVSEDLKSHFESIKDHFQSHEISFKHKNYNWKENNTDHLPGWNFVGAKKDIYPGVYFWFTEYEPTPERKEKKSLLENTHPNGIEKIKGFVMDLSDETGKQNLSAFANAKEEAGDLYLEDGTRFYSYSEERFPNLLKKKQPIFAVILESSDWEKTKPHMASAEKINFLDQGAFRISTHENGWDMIVVQKEK